MTGDNALGLLQAVHLAVEGGQAHALGFLDVIPDPAGRAEALSLKGLAQGAVVGALALGVAGKAMGLAGGGDACTAGLVELRDEIATLRADHQRRPPKGWGVVVNSTR